MPKEATSPTLQSWDDVDRALQEIGKYEIAINAIQIEMNISINDAKEKAANLVEPMNKQMTLLKAMIQEFTEGARADIEGKTKFLNFGKVGFRQSSSITVSAKKLDVILKNLKKFGMEDCIAVKETVNKEALKRYSDIDIAKVGVSRKVEDKFFLETDLEKLRRV